MTMTSQRLNAEEERLEIASDWLLRIQGQTLSAEELAQWLQWYDADPANRAAFEKLQGTFESIHALPHEEQLAWAARLSNTERHSRAPLGHSRLGGNPVSSFFTSLFSPRALAASLVATFAVIMSFAIWHFADDGKVQTAAFKTERAVHREVSLPDGSHVRLGAKSQLFVNFTAQTRYLVLEGGEAFFEVAKDVQRPFLVQAGGVTVRTVGTQFNVRRVMDQTIVSVTEGTVDVTRDNSTESRRIVSTLSEDFAPVRLHAREQVALGSQIVVAAVKQIEPKVVTGWQEGRLEFVDEPLGVVIGTINRYSQREVVIADRSLNDLRFTGTVSRERIDEWLFALSDIFPVDVRRAGNEAILVSQRSVQ